MKNLAHLSVETIDSFPFRESKTEYSIRVNRNAYDGRRERWRREDHAWKLKNRIIGNNIGKSFDMAFHYYCTKVKQEFQHIFLEEFEQRRNKYHYNHYYIDDQGLIQYNKRNRTIYKKTVTFRSIDYKTEVRHKVTFKKIEYPLDRWGYKSYGKGYEEYIVSGFEIEFPSKQHRTYKRLMAEKKKKEKNYYLPRNYMSEETFRKDLKKRKAEDKEENLLNILRHGFDPLTSFRR